MFGRNRRPKDTAPKAARRNSDTWDFLPSYEDVVDERDSPHSLHTDVGALPVVIVDGEPAILMGMGDGGAEPFRTIATEQEAQASVDALVAGAFQAARALREQP